MKNSLVFRLKALMSVTMNNRAVTKIAKEMFGLGAWKKSRSIQY